MSSLYLQTYSVVSIQYFRIRMDNFRLPERPRPTEIVRRYQYPIPFATFSPTSWNEAYCSYWDQSKI